MNKKGASLLTVIICIIMVGISFVSVAVMISCLQNKFADSTEKTALDNVFENFKNDIRTSPYSELKDKYNNKEFDNYMDSGISIKSTVSLAEPCDDKGVCDFTIVKVSLSDKNGKTLDVRNVNRAFTHFTKKEPFIYTGHVAQVSLPQDIIYIKYAIWGAGGGTGGDDGHGGVGRAGGGGGSASGRLEVVPSDIIQILVGAAGRTGGHGGSVAGATAGSYGAGGNGGGTGWHGGSGAGGSGGGRSAILKNGVEIITAGGGGGGGGGSNYVAAATTGSWCTTQVGGYNGGTGGTCPSDGGGGGGGGGGYYGGVGGNNGFDKSWGNVASNGGCVGGSYTQGIGTTKDIPLGECLYSEDGLSKVCNPENNIPADADNPDRNGLGGTNRDGRVVLYLARDVWSTL